MTDRLSIYNGALDVLGERDLADLDEDREPRHVMDNIWDRDFVDRVLQMGQWNFAGRSVELSASPSVTPSFGHQYAFDKPTDFIRTMAVAYDGWFEQPITRYNDEGQWIFCDTDLIYLKYVSSDDQFGSDFSLWPKNFAEMAEHYMAYKAGPRIAGIDIGEEALEKKYDRALTKAKGTDAMESPAKFPPEGNWCRSRRSPRSSGHDRGSRQRLIG